MIKAYSISLLALIILYVFDNIAINKFKSMMFPMKRNISKMTEADAGWPSKLNSPKRFENI